MSLALSVLVSTALVLGPAPRRLPDRFEDLEAQVHDLAGQKRYRELALVGAAGFERRDLEPYQRRAMAFFAIRGMHGMFEETGQVANLCDAGRLMRRVQHEVGLAEDAATATRLREATEKHLAKAGVKDPCPKKAPAKTSGPLLAEKTSPHDKRAKPAPAARGAVTAPPLVAEGAAKASPGEAVSGEHAVETDEDGLLAVARTAVAPKNMVARTGAEGSARPQPPRAPVRPDRDQAGADRFVQGGLAFVTLGVAASVGLGVSLHYRARASATIDVLRATADMRGYSTPEEYAQARDLNESYRNLTVAAGVGGALAAAGVVGAVTLFALRARRGTTLAGPWVGPAGAGLSIRGRF